mgnify:CR=1 FL=1
MMMGGMPPQMQALLAGGGGQQQPSRDALPALQAAIEDIHKLMIAMPDAAHVNVVAQCLRALTGIQKELMPNGPKGQGGQS